MASKVGRALAGLLIAFGFLLGLEALSRVAYTLVSVHRAHRYAWLVPSERFGWERRPGFRGSVGGARRAFDDRGFVTADSAQVDDTDRPHVLFVGDSTTFGFRASTPETFVEQVDRLLPDVDAINLGVNGYTSWQGLQVLRHFGPLLSPAVVVVSFNFNDRRYVLDPEGGDGTAAFHRRCEQGREIEAWSNALSDHLYLYRGLAKLLTALHLAAPPPTGPRVVRLDHLRARVEPDEYQRNLEAMVEAARGLHASPIFLVLGDNPLETDYLRRGIALLERGDAEGALGPLEDAVARDGVYADLARLYLARADRALDRDGDAEHVLTVGDPFDSVMGGFPIYLDSQYQEVMRRVAAEDGVPLVEAARVLARTPEDFADRWCHFDALGHRKVAALLAPAIREALEERD